MLDIRTEDSAFAQCANECGCYGETIDANVLALMEPPGPIHRRGHQDSDLELPRVIWQAMGMSYGVFFAGLWLATGHGAAAVFALAISIGYAVMYFGTASILLRQAPPERPSPFATGRAPLATWTGAMGRGAVAAQVLAIPFALAAFGSIFALLRAVAL